MVDISTVSIVVASAGVFAAAVYYILQLRHQARARQDMVKAGRPSYEIVFNLR